jgi:hypothetical protein
MTRPRFPVRLGIKRFGRGTSGGPASAYGCEDSVGRALSVSMDSESEVIDEKAGRSLVISQSVQRAAGEVVHQAFERLISSV